MRAFNIPLIDNFEFLAWAAGEKEYTGTQLSPLTQATFLSRSFARPIENLEDLEEALTVMFNNRVDLSLDFIAVFGILPFPAVDTCTEETQDAYYELTSEYYDGAQRGLDLSNQEDWLKSVSNWLGTEFNRLRQGGESRTDDHGHSHGPGGHSHGPGGHTH